MTESRGRIAITLQALWMGEDLLVALHGGDRAHIGAVAVSQPRPDGGASTSVMTMFGHREDQLARDLAHRIARETGVPAAVACGIHVDRISAHEIEQVVSLCEELATRLIQLQQESHPD